MKRIGLRGKILLITVITPLSLGLAAFVTVNRNVRRHVDSSSIHESLEHSVLVFENMLAARGRALAGGGAVIARDPRFFSLLTLGADQRDSRFDRTVRGMANDFNGITQTDMFEVLDRGGRRLASVGEVASTPRARQPLVAKALRGTPSIGVIVQGHHQYQISVTPARADGRIVGALLLGSEIGERLAFELHDEMRSEVTFVSDDRITGTTVVRPRDRDALLASLPRPGAPVPDGVTKVKGEELTYITVTRRLPGSDPAGRQFFLMQRAIDPEAAFLQQMQRDLGLLGVVAVLAALLTGLALSDQITRPIQELVRCAQEMQRGNYTHPIHLRSSDEIGYLGERFMEMRQHEKVYVSGLEEATRLKSEFINIASHELRTPISVIEGYRDLLAGGTMGPLLPQQEQALEAMREGIRKLTRIAEQATRVAQIKSERLEIHPVTQPVAPLIRRAIGGALASAPTRRVHVQGHTAEDLADFPLDGDLVVEAISHLISHGIRVTPDGGRVEVTAREEGGHLAIDVTDQGPGIPESYLSRLFEHGYTAQDSHEDHASHETGSAAPPIGFGITRGVAEAHGGTVSASNLPEGGSRFSIRILKTSPGELEAA